MKRHDSIYWTIAAVVLVVVILMAHYLLASVRREPGIFPHHAHSPRPVSMELTRVNHL